MSTTYPCSLPSRSKAPVKKLILSRGARVPKLACVMDATPMSNHGHLVCVHGLTLRQLFHRGRFRDLLSRVTAIYAGTEGKETWTSRRTYGHRRLKSAI